MVVVAVADSGQLGEIAAPVIDSGLVEGGLGKMASVTCRNVFRL